MKLGITTVFAIGTIILLGAGCSDAGTDERAEMEALANTMYVHSDACAQEYEDGSQIANEIDDPYLQKKYLLQAGYLTELDVLLSKNIWMENCMWQKAIYNRYGLGIK